MLQKIKERVTLIAAMLKEYIVAGRESVTAMKYLPCGYRKPGELPDVSRGEWTDFSSGDYWGGESDMHAWFVGELHVPARFAGRRVELHVDTLREGWDLKNPQFMLYLDGELVQAFDINHRDALLPAGRSDFSMDLYAYTSQYVSDKMRLFAELRMIDEDTRRLYYDLSVPLQILAYTDENDKIYADILMQLERAVDALDMRRPHSQEYTESVKAARAILQDGLYGKMGGKAEVCAVCIGHTHIDLAWLWTLAQTREKVVRTFSTVVKFMEQYPEYRFMSSQAYLYSVVKEDEPALYEKIKKLIKEGRWEAEGAMWVEADCNLSGGESLVRQILYGKRFFREEFGVDCKILWLPDVFGYSAAMPQILRKSGVGSFLTTKISWNDTNRLPRDIFYWQGIDGSEVLTYFLCTQTKRRGQPPETKTWYVGFAEPAQIAGSWDRFQQKEFCSETLVAYGYGDGGGGPTIEHLENLRRMEHGLPGCPRTKQEFVGEFFERMHERARERDPGRWAGELYLEYHRGTYTTMARNKRFNRKSEHLLRELELQLCMNRALMGGGYPAETLRDLWKVVLLNQFHDIIPGSSIKEVYEDSKKQYLELTEKAESLLRAAREKLAAHIGAQEGEVLVFNPHSFVNSDVVQTDEGEFFAENVPAKGYRLCKPDYSRRSGVKVGKTTLENKFFRLQFNAAMELVSVCDKRKKREVLPAGKRANVLRAYDEPMHDEYDAWETREYARDKFWDITDVVSAEPFVSSESAGFVVKKRFMDSEITQRIVLYDRIPRIDFDTRAEWKEKHILVKALFPVAVNHTQATYDIQFGWVQRDTNYNTSWQQAKYEVCAHKFADVSEGDYGAAVLNDCKYGYDVHGDTLSLSLLRSPTYPNPDADRETHLFRYAFYPHEESFGNSGTIEEAYRLNLPMTAVKCAPNGGKLPASFAFMECDAENLIAETVKGCEDGEGTVVRLYESRNRRGSAKLRFGIPFRTAQLCDLLERPVSDLNVKDGAVQINYGPFEIITILLKN